MLNFENIDEKFIEVVHSAAWTAWTRTYSKNI